MRSVYFEIRAAAVLVIKLLFGYADFSLFGAPSSKVKFVNVCGGMEAKLHLFVTSGFNGTDWSTTVPGVSLRYIPNKSIVGSQSGFRNNVRNGNFRRSC